MSQEIERKFLVTNHAYREQAFACSRIVQGYICRNTGRTVRIRVRGEKGYLTIKGASQDSGLSRYEWEKEIPVEEALELMRLCESGIIDKHRYLVACGKHTFEIDEFHGDNEGLVIAEVELTHTEETFERPSFLGKEVTGERRYYNSCLTLHPYNQWKSTTEE